LPKDREEATAIFQAKLEFLEKQLKLVRKCVFRTLYNIIPKSLPSDLRRALIYIFTIASYDPEHFNKNIPDDWMDYLAILLKVYDTFSKWEQEIIANLSRPVRSIFDDVIDGKTGGEGITRTYWDRYDAIKSILTNGDETTLIMVQNMAKPVLSEIRRIILKMVKKAVAPIMKHVKELGIYGVKTKLPTTLQMPPQLLPPLEEEE